VLLQLVKFKVCSGHWSVLTHIADGGVAYQHCVKY